MARLKTHYIDEIRPNILSEFGLTNELEAPRLSKITINVGTGKHFRDAKQFEKVASTLATITGQKPVPVQAKRSISQFRIRKGMTIGLKVTLRGNRMYEFLDRLISVALPRTRDFQGIPLSSIDKQGNANFGIKEQIIFPELSNDQLSMVFGMQINMTIDHSDTQKSEYLLRQFGFPFQVNHK